MVGTDNQIREGSRTLGAASSGKKPAQDGSISGKALLDLNRSPVAGDGDSQNEALNPIGAGTGAFPVAVDLDRSLVGAGSCVAAGEGSQKKAPIAAGKRASPVAVYLDRSPIATRSCFTVGEGSQNESPIAPGTRASPVVVDLDRSPVAGADGSQHEALIALGTQNSPIDVESLVDEGRRNRTGTRRGRPVVVVDLEGGTDQQGGGDTTTYCRPSGSKRRRVAPVIRLSPVRVERSSNQQRSPFVPVSRPSASAAPKEPVFKCPVCLNKMEQPSATNCGHVFCEKCIKASIKVKKQCPTCRKKLTAKSFHRVYLPATSE